MSPAEEERWSSGGSRLKNQTGILANTSSATLSRIPHLQPVPYDAQDPLKEFIPIMSYSYYLYGLAVKSDSPWKTLEEFVAYAKNNPGTVSYTHLRAHETDSYLVC